MSTAMKQLSMRRGQEGMVLIMALVILVLVTLIGLSTIRTTTMEERMAGNSRDRDKALQAAEAAVRECLAKIDDGTFPAAKKLTPAAAGAPQLWDDNANWTGTNSYEVSTIAGTLAAAGLSAYPRCLVETLGAGGSYRVTGRAVGGSADTVVILQATYSTE